MELTKEHKLEIERKIMQTIIGALESGKLTNEEYNKVADFVLSKIEHVKNHTELMVFLQELTAKWQVFSFILTIENGIVKRVEEKNKIEHVQQLIKNGDVEKASELLKHVAGNNE